MCGVLVETTLADLVARASGPDRRPRPYQRTMTRPVIWPVLIAVALAAATATQAGGGAPSLRIGGTPLALVAASDSLWALTCERRCSTREGRTTVGRIVRIDPLTGRVVASVALDRPHALAVGPQGVYANDFWRGSVRRLDPTRLAVTATTRLVLPFEVAPGDDAFLPFDVEVDRDDVWVSTNRGALARLDPRRGRLRAMVRIPGGTSGDMVATEDAVWVGESLLGVYRVDQATNRVAARIRIGPPGRRFVVNRLLLAAGKVLGVGSWTEGGAPTNENGLARIDPKRNRVEAVTPLPSGPLAVAFGMGSLWVGRVGGSSLDRIDPRTGEVVASIDAGVGSLLAVTGAGVWTAGRDGWLRRIAR